MSKCRFYNKCNAPIKQIGVSGNDPCLNEGYWPDGVMCMQNSLIGIHWSVWSFCGESHMTVEIYDKETGIVLWDASKKGDAIADLCVDA